MDVVRAIRDFNAGRDAERLALKYRAMRADAFGFLRGSCHLFYARLPGVGQFGAAPPAWSCGDLHLANFGSYKGDNRLAYFDFNDFDEALLAPASWDLVRLLASVWIAAGETHFARAESRALCQVLLAAYRDALAGGKAYWVERETARGIVGDLLDGVRKRTRPTFLDTRTRLRGAQRVLRTDNDKALPASDAQRAAVTTFMAGFAATQPEPRFHEVLDVARRVAGTGSLGVDRYSILVHGKGSPDGNYLLDLKRALPSSLAPFLTLQQPHWPTEAHRIVALQRRLQAVSMAFLQPVMLEGLPYVLRALDPSEDRVEFKHAAAHAADLHGLLTTLGRLTAWAQLRSAARQGAAGPDELIDFGRRPDWCDPLLDAAEAAALQVRKDAAAFDTGYDEGAFGR
jgi:uncharacterized protein (DUF2252 family)